MTKKFITLKVDEPTFEIIKKAKPQGLTLSYYLSNLIQTEIVKEQLEVLKC